MTRQVPIEYRAGTSLMAETAAAIAAQTTLGHVTAWVQTLQPPRRLDEIITQDEYTHDVLLDLAPDCWLVYDTT